MITFDVNVSLKIGDPNSHESKKSSIFTGILSPFKKISKNVSDFCSFLKRDVDMMYWLSYDTGEDAYQILIDRQYGTGFYYNFKNPSEYFFKTFTLQGNPVFGINMGDNSAMGQVNRMEGQMMVPTSAMISTSIAEAHVTDIAYEQGFDPFIPLKVEFDGHGNGYMWYGRYTHFTLIQEYFDKQKESLRSEEEAVQKWLDEYIEEEDDTPLLAKIMQRKEMTVQQPQKRKYTKKAKE